MNRLLYLVLVLTLSLASCQDFEDLSQDPNRPTSVPASLLLNNTLAALYDSPWGQVHRWNQYSCVNYNYYGTNEYSWTSGGFEFFTLKNVIKMEEEALKTGAEAVNPYSAMGKFLRAFFAYDMTMRLGDIPFTEALLGSENIAPKYDNQKQVFLQILTLLDQANDDMGKLIAANNTRLDGDIYLGGDLAKWQKTVNTFKLRVLVQLSKKDSDVDLKVKQRFAEVLGNASKFPIMQSAGDNVEYKYISGINNYPLNPGNQGFDARRYNMSATLLNNLVALKDPRTFIVADPTEKALASGLSPTDFNAYLGAESGEDLADMSTKMGKGEYSAINQKRYYGTFGGPEPSVQIGYIEMCFNIAEAINRGWLTGDAADWYNKGITASMKFFGITDDAAINAYLATAPVAYKGNTAEGLNQVLMQRYLGMFMMSGMEAYFHWRRTGQPFFYTGVGTGNGGVIPFRFQYPLSERTTNKANYEAALQSQFGGKDDVNAKMWVIQ